MGVRNGSLGTGSSALDISRFFEIEISRFRDLSLRDLEIFEI
jgi:hypothetical protein